MNKKFMIQCQYMDNGSDVEGIKTNKELVAIKNLKEYRLFYPKIEGRLIKEIK